MNFLLIMAVVLSANLMVESGRPPQQQNQALFCQQVNIPMVEEKPNNFDNVETQPARRPKNPWAMQQKPSQQTFQRPTMTQQSNPWKPQQQSYKPQQQQQNVWQQNTQPQRKLIDYPFTVEVTRGNPWSGKSQNPQPYGWP